MLSSAEGSVQFWFYLLLVLAILCIGGGFFIRIKYGIVTNIRRSLASVGTAAFILIFYIACFFADAPGNDQILNALPFSGKLAGGIGDFVNLMQNLQSSYDGMLAALGDILYELSKLFFLSLCINIVSGFFPKVESWRVKFFVEWMKACIGLFIYLGLTFLLEEASKKFWAFRYVPLLLMIVAAVMLVMALFSLLFPGLQFLVVFFAGEGIGKSLTDAVLSTAVIVIVLALSMRLGVLNYLYQATSAFSAFVPMTAAIVLLLYVIGSIL